MKNLLLFSCFLFLGLLVVFLYKNYSLLEPTTKIQTPLAQTTPFSLAIPPKASLKGRMISLTGIVDWQSREATIPAALSQKQPVLQGEEYWTKDTGRLNILFPNIVQLFINYDTHISFIQTLPTNFVMLQNRGEVTYTKLTPTTPVAIRVLGLLVAQQSGEAVISIDEEESLITITVKEGSVTIAFNDRETVSNVITVEKGYSYIFDNETREGELTATDE